MSRPFGILLLIWNVVLSALLGWSMMRAPHASNSAGEGNISEDVPQPIAQPIVVRDTGALKESKVAYFWLDSVTAQYHGVKERNARFKSASEQMDKKLNDELAKAQARFDELQKKDRTYTTQAENQADEQEIQQLAANIRSMQAKAQQNLEDLEGKMLDELQAELTSYLEKYNAAHGFDFIYMLREPGQIWAGNLNLDITQQVIAGMNADHTARKSKGK